MPTAPPKLLDLLDRWQPRRVLVAGDFMLDRYSFGHVDRLSPDAPVPILEVQSTDDRPGGAANVCRDLVALRCEAIALGIVGSDATGQDLSDAMRDAGIDVSGLVPASGGRPTTIKHNLVGLAQHRHPQKMFRLDVEDRTPLDDLAVDALLARAQQLIDSDQIDVVCLEDYAKGVCTPRFCQELISLAHQANIPALVDPAAIPDYTKYAGATAITPNRTEARLATARRPSNPDADLAEASEMARELQDQHGIRHVVITLDKSGALLRDPSGTEHHVPTRARAVYDVTGAGDMVLAALAGAVANEANWPDAVALANLAAGLEVEKPGVVPIPLDDLLLEVLREQHETLGKARTLEQLLPELRAHRSAGKTVAFTNGCFDVLHAGHVQYLRSCATHADLLVVGLNSDASIARIKSDKPGPPRPINQEPDRVLVLSELQSIDYVVVFDDDTPLSLIQAVSPDVLLKGADYQKHDVVGHEVVEAAGGRVELVPLVAGRSTTNILRQLGESG
ncbi:MAG: bifunctional heptose 7-phosphate kinase/heptose 1-phosphate adenyltransferase [Planctomycetota bacterium]